jgi:hypothetical protein
VVNRLSLLAELRRLLARPDTQVIQKRQRICGQSTWEYDEKTSPKKVWNIKILLDPRRDGRVRLVIHELLHIWLSQHSDLRMTYEVEEAAILAWEKLLYEYLHSPKREHLLESWDQAIQRKMA